MEGLWQTVVEGLEDLIRQFGLARIVLALSAVAAALLGLGIAISEAVLLVATGVFLVVVLLFAVLALGLDRRRLYRQVADLSVVLDRYGAELKDRQQPHSFTIEDWIERIAVSKNGDAEIIRWFKLVVGPEPLEMFWHRCYKTTAPVSRAYQAKVRVSARAYESTAKGRELGTRYPVTTDWEGHSLRTFVHFYESQDPATTVQVRIKIVWPRYYKELVEGTAVEPFEWTLRRHVQNLDVAMEFKKQLGIKADFRTARIGAGLDPVQEHDSGALRVSYSHQSPPLDTRLGFRLERAGT